MLDTIPAFIKKCPYNNLLHNWSKCYAIHKHYNGFLLTKYSFTIVFPINWNTQIHVILKLTSSVFAVKVLFISVFKDHSLSQKNNQWDGNNFNLFGISQSGNTSPCEFQQLCKDCLKQWSALYTYCCHELEEIWHDTASR